MHAFIPTIRKTIEKLNLKGGLQSFLKYLQNKNKNNSTIINKYIK